MGTSKETEQCLASVAVCDTNCAFCGGWAGVELCGKVYLYLRTMGLFSGLLRFNRTKLRVSLLAFELLSFPATQGGYSGESTRK